MASVIWGTLKCYTKIQLSEHPHNVIKYSVIHLTATVCKHVYILRPALWLYIFHATNTIHLIYSTKLLFR